VLTTAFDVTTRNSVDQAAIPQPSARCLLLALRTTVVPSPSLWERYRPGGYHHIDIDETFSSGRYRVIRKLGWGGYSTVWLAYDSALSQLAVLKVIVAEISKTSNEARTL